MPAPSAAMLLGRNGSNLSLLRQAPGLRPEPLALHGRHQAALRCEPPEGPHRRERRPQARLRLHALPQGRQGHEGTVTSAGGPSLRGPQDETVLTRALVADPSLLRFRAVVEAALTQLEARRQEVNDLNVFPVADGDTGDNM